MTPGKQTVLLGTGIPKNDWEEAEAHYRDWETSQDWHQSTRWFAKELSRISSSESKNKLGE